MPITRCPQCHTAFRVVADQLRVRNGLVRCGVCSTVFDGRASLESEQAPAAPMPPQPTSPFGAPAAPVAAPVADSLTAAAPRDIPTTSAPASELPAAPAPFVPQFPPQFPRSTAPRAADAFSSARSSEPAVPPAPAPLPMPPAAPQLPVAAAVPLPPPAVLRGRVRAGEGEARPVSAPVIRARDGDDGFSASQDRVLRAEPDMGRRDQRLAAEAPSVLRGRADRRQEPAFGASAHLSGNERDDDEEDRDDEPRWRAEPPVRTRRDEPIRATDDEDDRDDGPQWRADPPIRGHGRAHDASPFRASVRAGSGRNEPGLRHDDEDDIDGASDDAVYGDARTRYSSATDSGRAPPEFLDQDRIDSRRTWRRLWTWACLLGLLALAAQLVFAYRTSIAIAAPGLRPALTTVCQAVGCTVGYARRIERISIVSSSLRPPSGAAAQAAEEGRSRLVLTVVLRNRYDKEQHWPALMLDLTDLSDTVVARKAILPEAYLPAGTKGPLGPGAEITLTVPIQVAGLQVNGYQLDKFFP